MSEAIRVLIADDHPIVRSGLRASIESHTVHIVGEAADGQIALDMIQQLRPDVALIDMEMPRKSGLDLVRESHVSTPETRVVFLTLHKNRDLFHAAVEAGASGYLLKDDDPETILECLRAVTSGRIYFSSSLTASFASVQAEVEKDTLKALTVTERHIVMLIAQGKTSKEIGDILSLHYRTVENHRTNICRKLKLNGPSALLRFALQTKDKRDSSEGSKLNQRNLGRIHI